MAVTFRFVGEDQYQVEDGFSLSMMDVLFPGFLISRFMEVRFHCTRIFNRDFTEAKLKNKNKMDMKLYLDKKDCCGCGACADCCPQNAVQMMRDAEGFWYPKIDRTTCTNCGRCRQVCPLKRQDAAEPDNLYLGVQAKDDKLRYSSSSGGLFSILSEYVIHKNGVVYGAAYNRDMNVVHQAAEERSQLDRIIRTKYVQSDMTGIYRSIERDLKRGRWVLFCGTPCQAQALILYLGRVYDRLIVVDLVCYGVPSPGIWEDYVNCLERRHKGKMTDFSFRDKRNADNGHTRAYVIDGKEYVDSLYRDFFSRMYFKNRIIRPSCHSCRFCTVRRESDFTIGDFWGIERSNPGWDDGMGTSMVIAHTDKAKDIWGEIRQNVRWFVCTEEALLQPRLLKPVAAAVSRQRFMMLYRILPFSAMMKLMDR